jgi:hypothetical protein
MNFENQGPLKIMTTQWNLVAFYDLTDSQKRTETFNEYIHATDKIRYVHVLGNLILP